jgi:hypothetical protein
MSDATATAMSRDDITLTATGAFAGDITGLNLYDPSDTLIATASGNAPDGSSSKILWTALSSGDYSTFAEPGGPSFPAVPSSYSYTITIDGATGSGGVFPAPMPEPSTVALMLLGVGLAFAMRKRIGQGLPQAS